MEVSIWPKTGEDEMVLARTVARLVFPCNEFDQVQDALGLNPASSDVMDAEHAAVHACLERLGPLAPALLQLAEITGVTLARGLTRQVAELSEIDPDILGALCCRSAYEGLFAGLSVLAQHGLLALPRFA
jgi:hypothetical protein